MLEIEADARDRAYANFMAGKLAAQEQMNVYYFNLNNSSGGGGGGADIPDVSEPTSTTADAVSKFNENTSTQDQTNEGGDGCKNCPVSPFTIVEQPSTTPEAKKWDLNGDGKIDDKELTNWRENGKGKSIVLDAGKLNVGELDYRNMKPGDKHTFYLYSGFILRGNGFQEGRIIGAVGAVYVGGGRFTLNPNENDYKTGAEHGSPWFNSLGGFGRNVGTKVGLWIDGGKNGGTDFMIYFSGYATPRLPSINPPAEHERFKTPGNW